MGWTAGEECRDRCDVEPAWSGHDEPARNPTRRTVDPATSHRRVRSAGGARGAEERAHLRTARTTPHRPRPDHAPPAPSPARLGKDAPEAGRDAREGRLDHGVAAHAGARRAAADGAAARRDPDQAGICHRGPDAAGAVPADERPVSGPDAAADRSGAGQVDQPDLCRPQRRRPGVAGRPDAHRGDERPLGSRGGRGAGAVHRLRHPGGHELAARDSGRDHATLLTHCRRRRGRCAREPRTGARHRRPRPRQGIHGAEPPRRRHRPPDLQHCHQPRLQRRPHGAAVAQPPPHPLPHRRRAARARPGPAAAGVQRERAVDRVAREDPGQTRHRRAPTAAGRQLQAARRRTVGRHARLRPARVGDAELLRRERGGAHPRSTAGAEVDRQPQVRATGARAAEEAAVAHLGHRPHHRPDGVGQEHHALRGAAVASTARKSASSPPRIRSNTSTSSSASRRWTSGSATPSRATCARSSATTPR